MKLYGQEKSDEEVREFVTTHHKTIAEDKYSRYNELVKLFPKVKDRKALDYGCGWGHFSVEMRNKGFQVEAIDLGKNEVDIAKFIWGNQENINFRHAKIQEYEDASFDLVFSSQVIEHVHNPGIYLSEINRVLKDNGELIISLPNIVNPRYMIPMMIKRFKRRLFEINEDMLLNYDKGNDHINGWDPLHFIKLVSSVGFKLKEYIPAEGVPFPTKRPFRPFWHTRINSLKKLSYTMIFVLEKVKDVKIDKYD